MLIHPCILVHPRLKFCIICASGRDSLRVPKSVLVCAFEPIPCLCVVRWFCESGCAVNTGRLGISRAMHVSAMWTCVRPYMQALGQLGRAPESSEGFCGACGTSWDSKLWRAVGISSESQ
eukprot:8773595-Alexandrium_andersonii.AAC.1